IIRVLIPVSKTAPSGVVCAGRRRRSARPPKIAGDGGPAPPRAVLVVDDEEMVRRPCAAMVTHAGYRALTAAGGDEAVALFRDHADEIVCVILDLTMPGKDGVATFEALRRIKPDVRVILSSGYNEQEATQRFSGQGLAGFVKKPYEMETLLAELGRVATSRHLHHER
ncbi:MAG: response regulator, partial [Planctomycetota bacterium]